MAPERMDNPRETSHATVRLETPLGPLRAMFNVSGLASLCFHMPSEEIHEVGENAHVTTLKTQVERYFSRRPVEFTIPLAPDGTPFQKNVWKELVKIPFGSTLTYRQLASALGEESKTRAVASAIARNPILILIPCHRIIGSDGTLTGYSGGLERKKALLECEGSRQADRLLQKSIFD